MKTTLKIILIILYGVIAFALISAGINFADWQYWVVMLSVLAIDLISFRNALI